MHSTDSGRTWRRVAEQPPESTVVAAVAGDGEFGMTSLLAAAPDGAVVLALPLPPRSWRGRFPTTASVETLEPNTNDWRTQTVPCDSGDYETELSIAPNGSQWLACSSEPGAGAQLKSLAISGRPGGSWRTVARMCWPGSGCRPRMSIGGYLDGLVALNSQSAFYIGDRSSLTGTVDGGRGWHVWSQVGGDYTATLQATFCGARDGWAVVENVSVGGSNLWRTRNGGRSWAVS